MPSCRADEDHQEEHSSLELMDGIAQMCFESSLPAAPSEGCKIRSFRTGLDAEEQSSSSYRLSIGDASADIVDIDDRISSSTSVMRSKKVSKLLPYLGVQSRRFCWLKREAVIKFRALLHHMTKLAGIRSFENMAKTDVSLSSFEAEELQEAAWSIVEATSWMDWWTLTARSMALRSSGEV